jgi:hypothetical protein
VHTPVWTAIGTDVPQVDDIFGTEAVDECGESFSFNAADGQEEGLYLRRRNG